MEEKPRKKEKRRVAENRRAGEQQDSVKEGQRGKNDSPGSNRGRFMRRANAVTAEKKSIKRENAKAGKLTQRAAKKKTGC